MRYLQNCGWWIASDWRHTNVICLTGLMVLAITSCIIFFIGHGAYEIEADLRICTNGDDTDERAIVHKEGLIHIISFNCIQRSPSMSRSLRVFPLATSLSEPYLFLPKYTVYTHRITILTPVRDAAHRLELFATLLSTLSYPHTLISVHFGEDGSHDDTFEVAKRVSHQLVHKFGFANATAHKLKIVGNESKRINRHDPQSQIERRSHMGKARNRILEFGLQEEEWILWIDSDVVSFRDDLIQQFLYSNKDVMVASALSSHENTHIVSGLIFRFYLYYDLNTFREVVHNGTQYRIWLSDLKSEGREVPIDYVGGCTLMIRAECYRKGLRFTEGPYKPMIFKSDTTGVDAQLNIETEGLAKMARDLGLGVYGLPYLEVIHKP